MSRFRSINIVMIRPAPNATNATMKISTKSWGCRINQYGTRIAQVMAIRTANTAHTVSRSRGGGEDYRMSDECALPPVEKRCHCGQVALTLVDLPG